MRQHWKPHPRKSKQSLSRLAIYTSIALSATCPLAAIAQTNTLEAGVELLDNGSTTKYLPVYFNKYNAINAREVLRRIPGVADLIPTNNNVDDTRGFGSGGDQILINGKRLSGKSNNLATSLERIQSKNIKSIEVIRGTREGLDVRSDGLLVNIILDENAGGSGTWEANAWFMEGRDKLDGNAKLNYSDSFKSMQYQLALEYGPWNSASDRQHHDTRTAPDGTVFQKRRESRPDDTDNLSITGIGNIELSGGQKLDLNFQYSDNRQIFNGDKDIFDLDTNTGEFPLSSTVFEDRDVIGDEWEVGAFYSLPVYSGKLNTRFIYTRKNEDSDKIVTTLPVNGTDFISNIERRDTRASELVLRSSYLFQLSDSQTLDTGIEGARNTLDSAAEKFTGTISGLTEVDLAIGESTVSENRAEVFATHTTNVSDADTLELSLNWEYSNIRQKGSGTDLSRHFDFPKPRIAFTHDFNDANQLRLKVERTISQLDFAEFSASFDEDNEDVSSGNPNLSPEKTWEYEATFEHRLDNNRGLVSLKGFYKDITDHIDLIAVGNGSATGNIGDASVNGFEVKASSNLSDLGISEATVDITYTYQDTEATDPFLGIKRPIKDEPRHRIFLTYRQDISKWGFSYWFDAEWQSTFYEYRHNAIRENDWEVPRVNFSLEKNITRSLSFWMTIRASLDNTRFRDSEVYSGNVADDQLLFIEERREQFPREFIVGFRGSF